MLQWRKYAYLADSDYWFGGLRIVDISDPAAPSEVGFFDTPDYAREIALAGGYVYIHIQREFDGGLYVIDVSDPSSPFGAGYYDALGNAPYGVAVAGNDVYVADISSGLFILRTLTYQVYQPIVFNNDS